MASLEKTTSLGADDLETLLEAVGFETEPFPDGASFCTSRLHSVGSLPILLAVPASIKNPGKDWLSSTWIRHSDNMILV